MPRHCDRIVGARRGARPASEVSEPNGIGEPPALGWGLLTPSLAPLEASRMRKITGFSRDRAGVSPQEKRASGNRSKPRVGAILMMGFIRPEEAAWGAWAVSPTGMSWILLLRVMKCGGPVGTPGDAHTDPGRDLGSEPRKCPGDTSWKVCRYVMGDAHKKVMRLTSYHVASS